ncbi:MAG: hypothetical protein QXS54_04460 [Candidatus Methanomethylicaceae archaeon]
MARPKSVVALVKQAVKRGIPREALRRNFWATAAVAAVAAGVDSDSELERVVQATCGSYNRERAIEFFENSEGRGLVRL